MSLSRYLFSLIKVCKEVIRICEWIAVEVDKTLRLTALALNSCAPDITGKFTYGDTPLKFFQSTAVQLLKAFI